MVGVQAASNMGREGFHLFYKLTLLLTNQARICKFLWLTGLCES